MEKLEAMDITEGKTDIMEGGPLTSWEPSSEHERAAYPMRKSQVVKNIGALSVSFLFLFTAFQSLQNLQSSLNKEEGLGTVSLSVIYASSVVAGLFLPPFIIDCFGCKWTLVASMGCYIVYLAANLYPRWATMIPAAIVIGVGAAPLWAAKCTYLTQTAVWYSGMTKTTKDDIINRFFGVFFMAFQSSQIWGNLISSLVFSQHDNTTAHSVSAESLSKCGATFCPTSYENNTNLERPNMTKIYTVCGIYLGCAFLGAMIIVVVLDQIQLDRDLDASSAAEKKGGLSLQLMTKVVRHFWTSRYQKLLIPLTMYSGMEQAFIAGDFTRSYVSCTIGIWNVGFVMIAFGVTDAVCSVVFGRLVQFVGHIPFFLLAFLVHGGTQITLLVWSPVPDSTLVFYVLAVLWGVGDAVIQTQLNALYGYLFTDKPESAFASYRLCESAGFIVAFGYSSYLCTSVKLYICLTFLAVGMTLYGVVEGMERRRRRH